MGSWIVGSITSMGSELAGDVQGSHEYVGAD